MLVGLCMDTIRIGLLFSTTGPYATIGRAMRNGALLAVEEVNANPTFSFVLETIEADPGGNAAHYAQAAQQMLTHDGLIHVVGCYTSSSRKEVLPFFEKHDGLLWYPSHYEGFESSEHVVYTGAAPNQHIVPLAEHILRTYGKRAYCIGSNYIWAWENNKIMREAVLACGGLVLAERYFRVGEIDFAAVIEQILDCRPSFIFNTLIGVSAYEFFRAFRRAAVARAGSISAANCRSRAAASPSRSWSRSAPKPATGHLSSSVYFESIDSARNRAFVTAYRDRFPECRPDLGRRRVVLSRRPPACPRRPSARSAEMTATRVGPAPGGDRRTAGQSADRWRQPPLLSHPAHRRLESRTPASTSFTRRRAR